MAFDSTQSAFPRLKIISSLSLAFFIHISQTGLHIKGNKACNVNNIVCLKLIAWKRTGKEQRAVKEFGILKTVKHISDGSLASRNRNEI